jgi:hypothetical protein
MNRKDLCPGSTVLAAETLRCASSEPPGGEKGRCVNIGLVCRISAAALLGVAGLLGAILYQQLRKKVDRLGDQMVTQEEFTSVRTGLWNRLSQQRCDETEGDNQLTQRCARLEEQIRGSHDLLKDLGPQLGRLHDVFLEHVKESAARSRDHFRVRAEEHRRLRSEVRRLRQRLEAARVQSSPVGGFWWEEGGSRTDE